MESKSTLWPWAVCAVLLLATLLNYMDRQALAVNLPTLKQQFGLAEARVGMVEGCFGYSFAIGSILFGWLADRYGPRYLYPLALTGWSFAGIATGFAGHAGITDWLESATDPPGTGVYRWLLLCRIFLGICEAGHWPCALLTVRAVLTAKDRTLGNGILQSGASLGAILVPLYVSATEMAGKSWEFTFWSIGVVGLIWVPLWFLIVGQHPLHLPHDDAATAPEQTARTYGDHVLRRLLVLAVIVGTLTISWQFLRAWIVLFLQDHLGYSKEATRGLTSGYFIAADIGCILSGAWVTQLVRKGWTVDGARKTGFFLFSLLTACGALVPFVGDNYLMVACLFTAGAGILGLHPYYYSLTQEISVRRMGILSGGLAAGGWVVSSTAQIWLGRQIEATKSYEVGLLLVGLAPLLGLAALLLFWPQPPQARLDSHP